MVEYLGIKVDSKSNPRAAIMVVMARKQGWSKEKLEKAVAKFKKN